MANRTTLVINAWVGETKRCNVGLALVSRFGKTDWMNFTVSMVLPNDITDRRGRLAAFELETDVARPRSVQ